jgi:phosphate/sulfate permease
MRSWHFKIYAARTSVLAFASASATPSDFNIKGDVLGVPGMVLSAVSTVVGAIMYRATTARSSVVVQQHVFRLPTLGVILMVAGVIGFVISFFVFRSSCRAPSARSRPLDQEIIDASDNKTEEHERQS